MSAHLHESFVSLQAAPLVPPRDGFGQGLVAAAERNPSVVGLTADLVESTRMEPFAKRFPHRFFDVGVAEQNLMGVAAGLSFVGKIPFIASYGVFSPGRNWDQLRVSVCYSKANVKIAASHTGITVGPDGATHQALEDIAITRVLPNLVVLAPSDAQETRRATLAAAGHVGPVYLRFARHPVPVLTTRETPFSIGKAYEVRSGTDVTILSSGALLFEALVAAERLAPKISVQVINSPSIKPLDEATITRAAHKTKAIVTVEDHQRYGGFGSAVAELLVQTKPTPIEMVGVADTFGESGTPQELIHKYGLDALAIEAAVRRVLKRKR